MLAWVCSAEGLPRSASHASSSATLDAHGSSSDHAPQFLAPGQSRAQPGRGQVARISKAAAETSEKFTADWQRRSLAAARWARARPAASDSTAPSLSTHLHPTCPPTPKALLFAHVPKTGGTTVQKMISKACEGSVAKQPKHYSGTEPELQAKHGCIVQNSVSPLSVSESDAANFFVMASVRRPCDYYVSLWSFISQNVGKLPEYWQNPLDIHARSAAFVGRQPPYNSTEDVARFHAWMRTVIGNGTQSEPGTRAGSYRLANFLVGRLSARERVHCWVRTDTLLQDSHACFNKFVSCGGAWRRNFDVLDASVTSNVDEERSRCSTYFDDSAQEEVLRTEQARLSEFGWGSLSALGIDQCCPPPPSPPAPLAPSAPPELLCYVRRYPDLLNAFCRDGLPSCDWARVQRHADSLGRSEGRTLECTEQAQAAEIDVEL